MNTLNSYSDLEYDLTKSLDLFALPRIYKFCIVIFQIFFTNFK